MNLIMISGDRSLASGKRGAFWQTLEELRKHWERIDVICPHTVCHGEKNMVQGDTIFPNVFLHSSPHGLWYQPLWILWKGKELSRQRHYIVMTVHDYPPFYNGLGAWLLHRTAGIPWIAEIHHVVGYPVAADFREWVGRRMYSPYLRTIGRSAAAFRVVNAGAQELIARWGARREHIRLVPSFYLDHELLQPDPSIQKEYDIVFCGRLVSNKGVEELLAAAAGIHEPALRVLVVGDGPLRHRLQPTTYNLQPSVTFAGWLPTPRDVYRAMQSAKIFVMCSKSEGGPRIALEAMALGLPVIATRVGIMPEVIEDGVNGVFTTGDPDDLAEKIQRLLSDDQLRMRMGTEAKKVLDRFEKRRLIAQYADFLKSFT